jgi:hypothetical protein
MQLEQISEGCVVQNQAAALRRLGVNADDVVWLQLTDSGVAAKEKTL